MSPGAAASSALSARSGAGAEQRELRMRRVLAFTGVAPLGAFFVVHTITTATALWSTARFERIFASPAPALTWLTAAFVLGPLIFHALYGAYVTLAGKRFGAPSFLPRLRRVAAIATLAFLAYHLADVPARVWASSVRTEAMHDLLIAHLSSTTWGFPLRAVVYILGLAATAFHFGTSLWSFCATWGVLPTFRAQRTSAWVFGGLGVVMFAVGASTVVFFATGTRLLGPTPAPSLDGVLPHSPCPQPETK
jgi:succinate dehydrogenase/fumarate reductase cytochrome b subunit (b558 family)